MWEKKLAELTGLKPTGFDVDLPSFIVSRSTPMAVADAGDELIELVSTTKLVGVMTTLVPERENVFIQKGSSEGSSSKDDSKSILEKESCSSESPLSNDIVSGGGEGPENNTSTISVGESPATVSSMTITLAEAPVSNNNARVGEAPASSNNVIRVPPEKRSLYKFGQRTSNFRGVTRHRWTGKYEAHLWDNSTVSEGRKRKGKQVYLGGYETEEKAAQIYDLAALKYWGANANTKLNFPISNYEEQIEEMKSMSREEYVNSLRRNSICFTRGCSIYRGVTRQNVGRRWQARIGRVAGGKDIYLGTYDTEEEAAEAYDIAAVKLRGMNAITNFDISNYYKEGTKELDVIPIKSLEEESSTMKIRYFKLQ
ncbi:Ap2-like ethylene-responsive transcription factor plt2 [Thalictrum thalictroides]|uniref:Ap2-like ethylene-responsive transcription factor plt2 n=1 Tax=Thalictrum thalictroides TaxID=46969 RepID=A0A7J6VYB8_THATH|nr:Ap2-like ethylene-responsive transcription factor plt2 [Thalictrum thalictroides]